MIEIEKTREYIAWYRLLDYTIQGRIQDRLERVQEGNFGDHKSVGGGVWELRLAFGGGLRIYYTFDGTKVVLLLAGGNKSTQSRDIDKAHRIAQGGK